MTDLYDKMAFGFARIALAAARPVLDLYHHDIASRTKADGSPVTEADLIADRIIREGLRKIWPDIPIVSEENDEPAPHDHERFFLVDPLDGTREFINRNGAFTINIALVENGKSRAGCIYAPALSALYVGGEASYGLEQVRPEDEIEFAKFKVLSVRTSNARALTALASHSHGDRVTDAFLNHVGPCAVNRIGSSLKFCMLAKGEADFYPRFGPTMGWDIAAGDAILKAAGGVLLNEVGHMMTYDVRTMRNGPFIALGDQALVDEMRTKFVTAVRNQHHARNDIAEPKSS